MGELRLSPKEKKLFRENPDSAIVFIQDDYEYFLFSTIISSPLEIGANGATGLKYEAVKDTLLWNLPDGYSEINIKQDLDLIMQLGIYYVSQFRKS